MEEALPLSDDSSGERFRLLNDPSRLGVRVLEQRVCTTYINEHRIHQEPRDVGRLKGEVADLIGHLGLSSPGLSLPFTSVGMVGCEPVEGRSIGAKLALLPDEDHPLYGRLKQANALIFARLQREFPGFNYPNPKYKYEPHLTFAQVYQGATLGEVDACQGALNDHVANKPIMVPLAPLVFLPR
jgi:hypothetical protein